MVFYHVYCTNENFFVSDAEFLTVDKLDLSDFESNVKTMITPEEV